MKIKYIFFFGKGLKSLFRAAALSKSIRGKLKAYDHGLTVFIRSAVINFSICVDREIFTVVGKADCFGKRLTG